MILHNRCSSYVDDETSPVFCDPLYSEEYTYSILSKALVKRQAKGSVAHAATAVANTESVAIAAEKAVPGRTSKSQQNSYVSSETAVKEVLCDDVLKEGGSVEWIITILLIISCYKEKSLMMSSEMCVCVIHLLNPPPPCFIQGKPGNKTNST